MTEPVKYGEYLVVSDKVRQVLGRKIDVPNPFTESGSESQMFDIGRFRQIVDLGRERLPARYHQLYLSVLDEAIDQAEEAIAKGASKSKIFKQLTSIFSSLAQPIIQLDDEEYSLKAYLAVISNCYRRFLEDDQARTKLQDSGYKAELDPLGFLVDSSDEPFTIKPTPELPIAFIAKPAQYADFAPLFVVEGHEVGGHVLLSKIKGFSAEVKDLVQKAVRKSLHGDSLVSGVASLKVPRKPMFWQRPYKQVAVSTFMSETFATWSMELFCDACGVLNLGPAFVDGLILILAQINRKGRLSRTSTFSLVNGISTHPFDHVRAMFCIEILKSLEFEGKESHIEALEKRFLEASGGALPEKMLWLNAISEPAISVDLEDFRPLVQIAAQAICDSRLRSLTDRSMKDFMTWGNVDEATTGRLVKELISGERDDDLVIEARHVVSASLLAIESAACSSQESGPDLATFESAAALINSRALDLLSELYREQCLLCDSPVYGETRRQDLFRLEKLADLVNHPDRF